jgi:L-ribulose-5-phosphate 3-epimerase
MMNRRDCFKTVAGAALAWQASAASKLKVKIGSMAGVLPQGTPDEVYTVGKRIGLQGIEFNVGRDEVDGKLPLFHAERQKQIVEAAHKHGMAVAGIVLDVFHKHYLKSDPIAATFIDTGIQTAKNLKAHVLLLPFFGKAAMTDRTEMGRVADIVKEHAGVAQKAGVILGLEDTISAEDNAWMLDRIASPAVKVYYDIGNSTNNGFDTVKEIRWLGGRRIGQMHVKDRGYLGESGKIDIAANLRAVADSGFDGWLNFETSSPSKDKEADLKKNFALLMEAKAKAEKG